MIEIRSFTDIHGFENLELVAENKLIDLEMEITPHLIPGGKPYRYKWEKTGLAVHFKRNDEYIFRSETYLITNRDIPGLDTADREIFEESLLKYAVRFSKITTFENFKDLIGQIFVDIEGARKYNTAK